MDRLIHDINDYGDIAESQLSRGYCSLEGLPPIGTYLHLRLH